MFSEPDSWRHRLMARDLLIRRLIKFKLMSDRHSLSVCDAAVRVSESLSTTCRFARPPRQVELQMYVNVIIGMQSKLKQESFASSGSPLREAESTTPLDCPGKPRC